MNKITLYFTLFSLLMASCSAPESSLNVHVSKQIVPVLVRAGENPVLTIRIDNNTGKEVPVKSVTLTTEGMDKNRQDTISLYFTGTSDRFSPLVLFGNTVTGHSQASFRGDQVLKPGSNYFWASMRIAPETPLSGEINLRCKDIKLAGTRTVIRDTTPLTASRIGYALRKRGDDGINSFRIPGLVRTTKGTLIAVYDIRHNSAADLQGDIDIGVSRSLDNGQNWLPMQTAIDMKEWGGKPDVENGIGDPAILVDRQTGRIWIAALWLHGHPGKRAWWASGPGLTPQQTGQLILAYSDDEGATWSEPVNITPQIKKPEWYLCFNGPGMGISTKDGTLVFAAQFKDKDQIPHSTIIYSRDKGNSWHIGTGAKPNTTEAQVVELADGSLMLNMRDDNGGSRSVCVTRDLGKNWEEHPSSRSALPEPVCQASLIRITLKDGSQALAFFNPASTTERENLTLKLSLDEGNSWPEKYHIPVYEPDGYGYSCLTQIDSTTLGVLYEGVGELYFQRISLPTVAF